jgi:hypothetical protein
MVAGICGNVGTHSAPVDAREARRQQESVVVLEPLSPELVLVDPDLAARARAALPTPAAGPSPAPRGLTTPAPAPDETPPPRPAAAGQSYPLWARVTAALWLVVIGILIGGAAIPHAQDKPHLIPKNEDSSICKPETTPVAPPDVLQPGR